MGNNFQRTKVRLKNKNRRGWLLVRDDNSTVGWGSDSRKREKTKKKNKSSERVREIDGSWWYRRTINPSRRNFTVGRAFTRRLWIRVTSTDPEDPCSGRFPPSLYRSSFWRQTQWWGWDEERESRLHPIKGATKINYNPDNSLGSQSRRP